MAENLNKANKLEEEIRKLEHFLYVVTRFHDDPKSIPAVKLFVKRNVEYSFFGSRYFGLGTHEEVVRVPNSIRNDLIEFTEKRLNELKSEQESLFNPNHQTD